MFKIKDNETALVLAIEALQFYASHWHDVSAGVGDKPAEARAIMLPTPELCDDGGEMALRALAALRRYQADCIVADVVRELPWKRPGATPGEN